MKRSAPALVIIGLLILAAPASATTQTAQNGSVSASFTFHGHYPRFSHERLTISRAGVVVYDQAVASRFCGTACAPGSTSATQPSVHVVDLEHTGQPDVVLDLYTGGAHCCTVEQIFSFDPGTATYVKTERNFGDPGMQIVDLGHDGHLELLTADDSFAYRFTDYAASGLPVQVLRFRDRRFFNVTRQYPGLIAHDAGHWLHLFRGQRSHHYSDSVGVIAAWAADEDLLGHRRMVNRFLNRQARAGHLNSALGPGGKRFVAHLQRFLRRHGYRP